MASPTVTTEVVFLTCIIEAKEGREVAVVNLPGAFLHAENEDDNDMLMKGRLTELMVMAAPQTYRKFITIEKEQRVLYMKVQKAPYAMLKSALLFYQKLCKDLENMGFEVNSYNPCVANKMVNGAQMMVTWHIDDLKISHIDGWEITKIIRNWQVSMVILQ